MFRRSVPSIAGIHLHSRLVRLLRHCSLLDLVLLSYVTAIGGVILVLPSIRFWGTLLVDHALVVGLILLVARTAARRPTLFWRLVHCWYPAALTPIAYRELLYLVRPPIVFNDYDWHLLAADHFLFGVNPTQWLSIHAAWAPLVEACQLVYTSFFFIPVSLGILLCLRKRFDHYEEAIGGALLGFYTSYVGYFFVPALGPRFMPPRLAEPRGLWWTAHLRESLNSLELCMRDAFPSGHAEVTLVVLYFAWKFHRPAFWVLLPVVSIMVFATVYLQYHYVVDVLAGAALAAIVCPAASAAWRRWEEVRRSLGAA